MADERKETIREILEVLENNDSWFAQKEHWEGAADLINQAYGLYRGHGVGELTGDKGLLRMGGRLMEYRKLYASGERSNEATTRKLFTDLDELEVL